ncbi:SAC3/GANP/Nin1/mts3/eIF-3 p25 family-domain-containing protein [Hypoxylon sp. NC1633]|nr:SAC3/GANP/Nin1/mts3/eIF-3 p25 family-domain-containing protein [Hypoxylon sp. NC1633]
MSWAARAPPASYSHSPQVVGTAYTPVQIRMGFGQQPPTQAQYAYTPPANPSSHPTLPMTSGSTMSSSSEQQSQQQKFDWPDSVRSYVQRSFQTSNLDPHVTRAEMEDKLKDTIRQTQDSGTMYTTDWDNMPLPQTIIKNERQQALMQSLGQSTNYSSMAEATASAVTNLNINPKKRKSSDLSVPEQTNDVATMPWRSAAKGASFGDRVNKTSMSGPVPVKSKFQKNLEKRQRRGDGGYQSTYRSPSPAPPTGPIVGLNQSLEKRYLRLTAAPKPADVRPEHILHQTLDLLKKKWRKDANYNYICDQFKSLRQDLTVQRIRNNFTVSVYEIHARIALEKGDLGEYNQCQTQLRALYKAGLQGHPVEFKAYRILYFIHTSNRTALNDALADLTTAEKEERPIKHALNVRSALALGNYHRFFQLFLDVPNMGAYLMDMFVKRERLAALATICKSFKPEVKLRFITEELSFDSDPEAVQFIMDNNGRDLLQEREGYVVFLSGKAGTLFETARSEAFRRVDLKGQI